jgi:hypothetical protein
LKKELANQRTVLGGDERSRSDTLDDCASSAGSSPRTA